MLLLTPEIRFILIQRINSGILRLRNAVNLLYFFIEAMEDGRFEFAISEENDENNKD
jgi:hypothetical protein